MKGNEVIDRPVSSKLAQKVECICAVQQLYNENSFFRNNFNVGIL